MPFTWVTYDSYSENVYPVWIPSDRVGLHLPIWSTFIQTGRRSDPGFESVLTLINTTF